MTGTAGNRRTLAVHGLLAAAVVVVAVALYLPTLRAEFVYDARAQILTDDFIHHPEHVTDVLSLRVLGEDVLNRRRPVLLLSFMLDSLVWQKRAFGYHLTSVWLHALCALCLFCFLVCLERKARSHEEALDSTRMWGPLAGALLFAVHPVNSEAVCEVSYRGDILAAQFILVALCATEGFRMERLGPRILAGVVCVVSLCLSAGSKENGFLGPVFVLLYGWLFGFQGCRRTWIGVMTVSVLLVAGLAAASLLLAPSASAIFTQQAGYLGGSFAAMVKIQPRVWALQILHVLFPLGLSADYGPFSVRNINLTVALIILTLVLFCAWRLSRKSRLGLLAVLFFLVAMLPTSNIIPIYRPLADRFLYLPMVAFSILPVYAMSRIRRPLSTPVRSGLVILAMLTGLSLALVTRQRVPVWHDELALWQDTAARNPYSLTALDNLGFALHERGQFSEAIDTWQRVQSLAGQKHADAWAGMAIAFEALGQTNNADHAFREAVQIDPRYRDSDMLVRTLLWDHDTAMELDTIARRNPPAGGGK